MRTDGLRRGQAMIELAIGLFALVLVVSALCGFAHYIAQSLRIQNTLRAPQAADAASPVVDVGVFGGKWIFGAEKLTIRERCEMPPRDLVR